MTQFKLLITFLSALCLVKVSGEEITGRFAPPEGKFLVFVGSDNVSVGGTANYRDGYVENIGVPGGISHQVHFSEGWTNEFGHFFPLGIVAGLNVPTDWKAGPMHLLPYLESPMLERCAVHISIAMPGGAEKQIAEGKFDHLIKEFTQSIADHQERPFYVRIGSEFGTPGHRYDPENFRKAFRRIVDALRVDRLPNVAIVYSASTEVKAGQFEEYDPGSLYYDWIGYSWWGGERDGEYALEFARKVKKPAMVTEAAPLGHSFDNEDPEALWKNWFTPFFTHIEQNRDVVRAFSYSNTDWDSCEMWEGRGMTKIDSSPKILELWLQKMNSPTYLNSVDKPFNHINFPSPFAEPKMVDVEPYARYKDPELPTAERVADLLGKMTVEEKVAQVSAWWDSSEQKLRNEGKIFSREFYEPLAPHGIGDIGPINLNIEEDIRQHNAIQEYFSRDTRLGIPAFRHTDATHGVMRLEATVFPAPIALSCSWNPELVEEVFRHTAKEANSRGLSFVLGPNVNVTRDLRSGRVDETLGEDPFLVGRLGAAMVRGLQGSADGRIAKDHVAATVKHFAGLANSRGGLNRAPYLGGKAQLLDTEVEAFRHIIKHAQPAAIMPGHHEVENTPCHINSWLLNDVLRGQLGYNGLVIGDYGSISLIHENQKIGETPSEIAALALDAGVQLDLPDGSGFKHLTKLVENGTVPVSKIDSAAAKVLELKFKLGLFERNRLSFGRANELVSAKETKALALEAARQSIVLLKNDGILPLNPSADKKITVIGPNSDVCRLGSCSGTPREAISLLDAMRSYFGDTKEIPHSKGCMIALNDTHDSYLNWRRVKEANFVSFEDNEPLIEEAFNLAKDSDIIILALGENSFLGREAIADNHLGDRANLELTESQMVLAEAILGLKKQVILYLSHGRPITLGPIGDQFNAILTSHYAGQESGAAITEVLFGDYNPTGKLTVSWPQSIAALPSYYNSHRRTSVFEYIDESLAPKYPFGHGLSYTRFSYSNLKLSKDTITANETIEVTFDLQNIGLVAGTEITQLYVSGEGFQMGRPELELKGFSRVTLKPGESQTVTIKLAADDLHFHDVGLDRVLPKGKYQIRVGGSSDQLSEPQTLHIATEASRKPAEFSAERKKHPNILFVAFDDLRPELGAYGSLVKTPHIDRLASSGIRFDNAYCQQAVTEASRLSVMSGLYPTSKDERQSVTINQHFNQHGYETIALGKIYPSDSIDSGNWKRWIDVKGPEYMNLESIEALKSATVAGGKGPLTEKADVTDDAYFDGKLASTAVSLLGELSETSEKPFFMALGFTKPNLPFAAPSRYWDLYQRENFTMPSNRFIPPGYPPVAANLEALQMAKYSDFEGGLPYNFSKGMNQLLLHGYAASVSYVDACFGKVYQELENTGLAQNTIVVLWSDHGWKLGDHSTWCENTNFECDTRVPLIIKDPRIHRIPEPEVQDLGLHKSGGKSTSQIVELLDLYPTLCDLAGIDTPAHCQGRTFQQLLENPGAAHRENAYTSCPTADGGMGHTLRDKQYRYSEWYDNNGAKTHQVLTDLVADPGEQANLATKPENTEIVASLSERLQKRIIDSSSPKTTPPPIQVATPIPGVSISLDIDDENLRQSIDGFGGSIVLHGTQADNEALQIAVNGLNTSIIRAQGEIAPNGDPEHNRDILRRAMEINPTLEVLLTFWQPKSLENLDNEYWLDEVKTTSGTQYQLKPSRETEWAIEIALRIKQYRDWGINVTGLGVQNEPNSSLSGNRTCHWDPDRLADFIEMKVRPALNAARLSDIKIVAPELAFIGDRGTEIDRFIPVFTSQSVNIAAYHMYDSFKEETADKSINPLVTLSRTLSNLRIQHFQGKRLWMTETTGAQWESVASHTFGWTPDLSEHEKAIKAARYIHTSLAEAEANAFLWKGLVYGIAPASITDSNIITKYRDEGLVLVDEKLENGYQKFIERTKKFYTFRQYSGFVKPGYRRIYVDPTLTEPLQVSAFLSYDKRMAVAIAINDTDTACGLEIQSPEGMKLIGTFQTDETRNCSPIGVNSPMAPQSVRTIVFSE